jgi:hypothetical protein
VALAVLQHDEGNQFQNSGLQLKKGRAEMVFGGPQNHAIRTRTQAGNAIATAGVPPPQKHKF